MSLLDNAEWDFDEHKPEPSAGAGINPEEFEYLLDEMRNTLDECTPEQRRRLRALVEGRPNG